VLHDELTRIWGETDSPSCFVTHNVREAVRSRTGDPAVVQAGRIARSGRSAFRSRAASRTAPVPNCPLRSTDVLRGRSAVMASTETDDVQTAGASRRAWTHWIHGTGRPSLRRTFVDKILPRSSRSRWSSRSGSCLTDIDEPDKLPRRAPVGPSSERLAGGDRLGYIWTSVSRGLLASSYALLIGTPAGSGGGAVKFIARRSARSSPACSRCRRWRGCRPAVDLLG